jgi:hypothetical protein
LFWCGLGACLAGPIAVIEGQHFLSGSVPLLGNSTAGSMQPVAMGLSVEATQASLADCVEMMTSLYVRMQPTDVRFGYAQLCREPAVRSTKEMPTFSFGWLVIAEADAQLANIPDFHRAVQMSYATAPYEGWLANARVSLVETNIEKVDEAVLGIERSDLRTLIGSDLEYRSLVPLYVDSEAFRRRLNPVLLEVPDDAGRFLREVSRFTEDR